MQNLPINKRHHIVKHTSGWCAVGKMAKRWRLRPNDHCPRCGQPEATKHVWRCRDPEALKTWTRSVEVLTRALSRLEMAPNIIQAIQDILLSWKYHDDLPLFHSPFPGLQAAIAKHNA
jgi:predicted amidophosphoribosyltransferase